MTERSRRCASGSASYPRHTRRRIAGHICKGRQPCVAKLASFLCNSIRSRKPLVRRLQRRLTMHPDISYPVKFVSGLPTSTETAYVLYIVTPPAVIALESPLLRQLFSAVKRCIKTYPDLRVLFHFVPEALPAGALADSRFSNEGLDAFVGVIYDRLLQPVERPVSKQLASQTGSTRAYFQSPAFSLAPALPSRKDAGAVSFAFETQPSSLDLVNRHMLFHVGYTITPCKRWLLAASVDGRGDSHDLGAWLLPDESVDAFVTKQVWTFARTCAARASVEWRVAVAKLGSLGVTELDGTLPHDPFNKRY